MGDMLYLAEHDYTDVAAKVDLIGGVLQLRRGSWLPQVGAGALGVPVTETLDLVADGATSAEIIAELNKIEGLFEQARTWPINPVQAGGAWLEWGLDAEPRASGETGYPAKRAWIYEGKVALVNPRDLPGAFLNQRAAARLAVTRHPYWENLDAVEDTFLVPVYEWGDVTDLTGLTEMGTAPARIIECQITPTSGDGAITETWLGFRANNQGFSEFNPLWELEDGTNGTDTGDVSDATASGGYNVTCTFATDATLAERVSLSTNQAHAGTTNWDHFNGRYQVLLRAKVGSSTECGVRLRLSSPSVDGVAYEEVYIDNTAWKLIELGQVMLPIGSARSEMERWVSPRGNTFSIDAERLSGSGSLYLDCLYLIPAEHYFHAFDESASMIGVVTITDPTDRVTGWMQTNASPVQLSSDTACNWNDWHLPTDLAFMVVAGQLSTGHNMSTAYEVYLTWVPRWNLFRDV
jgi:hypothetical protein